MATRQEEGSSLPELDVAFRVLVDNIGLNWRTLAPELGITPSQIGWVTRQCGGNVMKEVFQCLCTWKETFSERATVQELVRALHRTKVRLLSRMADEIVKKCPTARCQMLSGLQEHSAVGKRRRENSSLSVNLPYKRLKSGTVQSSTGQSASNGSKVTSPQDVKVKQKCTPSQESVRIKAPFPNGSEGIKKLPVKGEDLKCNTQSSTGASSSESKSHDLKGKGESSEVTKSSTSGNSVTPSRTEIKSQNILSAQKTVTQKSTVVRHAAESTPGSSLDKVTKRPEVRAESSRPRRACTERKIEHALKPETSKMSEVRGDRSAKVSKGQDETSKMSKVKENRSGKEDKGQDEGEEMVAEIMILDEKTGRLVLGKKKPGQPGVQPVQSAQEEEEDPLRNAEFQMRYVVTIIKKTYRKMFCVPVVFLFGSLVRMNAQHVYTQLQMVHKDTQTPVEDIGSIITPQAQTVRAGAVMLVTPRRILIEGEQGIGKTTFCHKICYNWATLFNVYVQFSLVFKIDLASVRSDIISTICQQLIEMETKVSRSDMRAYIESRQHETLFILDGLDQLPPHAHPEYLALMKKEILPKSCVIVTTRPMEQLPCEFDSYYVIKGFTSDKRKEYVRKHLGRLSLKVIEELHSVWQLNEIISNPLNAVLLCRLYEMNQGLPDTFTAMFTKLVMGVVGWNCHRKGIEMKGEEIPSAVHQIIASLGHIAWEGLRNGLMSFDVAELRRCYPITNEILKFGFLMFVNPEEPCRQSLRCTFSHRVFQEIFSACYISTMARLTPESELTAAYLRLCTQEGFQQVCVFVSGLLKDKGEILFQQLCEQITFCSQLNRPAVHGIPSPLEDALQLALMCLHETGEVDRFAPLVAMYFANRLFISDWTSKSCLQSIVSILQYQDSQQADVEQEAALETAETPSEAVNDTSDGTAPQTAKETAQLEETEAEECKTSEEEKSISTDGKGIRNVEKVDTNVTETKADSIPPPMEENKGECSNTLRSKAGTVEGTDTSTEVLDQLTETQATGAVGAESGVEEEKMEVVMSEEQKNNTKEEEKVRKDEDHDEKDAEEELKMREGGKTKKKGVEDPQQSQTQEVRTLRRGRSRTSYTGEKDRKEAGVEDSEGEKEENKKPQNKISERGLKGTDSRHEDSGDEKEENKNKKALRKIPERNEDAGKATKGLKKTESSEEDDYPHKEGKLTRFRTRKDHKKDINSSRKDKDKSEGEKEHDKQMENALSEKTKESKQPRDEVLKTQESPRRSSRRKAGSQSDEPSIRKQPAGEVKKDSKSSADEDKDKNEFVDPIGSRTRRRTRSNTLQSHSDTSLSPKTHTCTSPLPKAARREKSNSSEGAQDKFVDPIGLRTRARGASSQALSKNKEPCLKTKESLEVESKEVDSKDEQIASESEEETQQGEGEFIDPIGLRVRGRRAKSIAREQLRVIADNKSELRRQESVRVSPISREMSPLSKKGSGGMRKSSEGEDSEEKSRAGRRHSPRGEDRQRGPKIKWGKGAQGKCKTPPKLKKEEEKEEDKEEALQDAKGKIAEETSKEEPEVDGKTEEQQEKEEAGPEESQEEEEEEEVLEEDQEEDQAGLHSLDISIFASSLQIVFRALKHNRIIRTLTFTDKFLPATRNICHLDWFDALGELFLHNTNLRTLIIDSANYRVTRGAFTNVVTAAVTSKSLQNVQLKFEMQGLKGQAEKSSGYIRLGIPLEKLTESPSLRSVSVELTSKMTAHEEAANDVTRTIVKLLKKPSNIKKLVFSVVAEDSYFLQVLPVLRAMQVNSTLSEFSIDMGAQPSTRYTLAAIKEVLTFNSGLASLRVKFHTPAPLNSDDLTEVFTAVENSDLRGFTLDMGCGWSTDPLDPPVLALADLLANNTTLRKLSFQLDCPWSPQAISNDIIALLCAALYANSTVKELCIAGIYTAEDTGSKIIQALLKHKGPKFKIDMPYWWNAYCKVAADYCEGIVMEHYFEEDEGNEKKKKKKKEGTGKSLGAPEKEESGTDCAETKAEKCEETTTTAENTKSETASKSTKSKTAAESTEAKTTTDSTQTKKDTCKPSSSDKADLAKACPVLSRALAEGTIVRTKPTEEQKEAAQETKVREGATKIRKETASAERKDESKTSVAVKETPPCSGQGSGSGKAVSSPIPAGSSNKTVSGPKTVSNPTPAGSSPKTASSPMSIVSSPKTVSSPKPAGSSPRTVSNPTPSLSSPKPAGSSPKPAGSSPKTVSVVSSPVSTRKTTAAALIQAGDDLPEFLNQFPEYKNARMIRSGRIMVNTEVACQGNTGYGSGFLSDTFKLTEAGRKKLEKIRIREAKNSVAVRETLFCSGKTNCQRECGGIGDCVRGCGRDSNRGHRCSFRVKLHMYLDRLNFWEVTVEGEHLPSSTGQQWIPHNRHDCSFVRNGMWYSMDQ